jgi:hypothetical protein
MSRKSNVNPDHYKTAGRDPQGQAVLQEMQRQKLAEELARLSRDSSSSASATTAPATASVKKKKERLRSSKKSG